MIKLSLAQSYIDGFADVLNTKVVQKPCQHGMMYVEYDPPMIEGPILDQPDDEHHPNYQCRILCLLHELGHVFYGHTQGRPPHNDKKFYFKNGVLKSECQAWNFALDRWDDSGFLPPLLDTTREYMWDKCLGSYYRASLRQNGKPCRIGNGNRHYVEFVYDKPDYYFWATKDRICGKSNVYCGISGEVNKE